MKYMEPDVKLTGTGHTEGFQTIVFDKTEGGELYGEQLRILRVLHL